LLAGRFNFVMPAIIMKSIAILSDAGLGMAMFSLGELLFSACMHGHTIRSADVIDMDAQVCSWRCNLGSSLAGTRGRRSPWPCVS
jgi:hypothetical protein